MSSSAWRRIRHYRMYGRMGRRLLSISSPFLVFRGWRCCRRFSDVSVWRWVLCLSTGHVRGVYCKLRCQCWNVFVVECLRYDCNGYHCECLAIDGRVASRLLMIVSRRLTRIAWNYVVGWVSAKQNGRKANCSLTSLKMGAKTVTGRLGTAGAMLAFPSERIEIRGMKHSCKTTKPAMMDLNKCFNITVSVPGDYMSAIRHSLFTRCMGVVQAML